MAQGTPDQVVSLVRQADFVGFVEGDVKMSGGDGEWRQAAFLTWIDPLKGVLKRDENLNRQFPYAWGGHVLPSGSASSGRADLAARWPTWFGEKGVYLVFLHKGVREGRPFWTSLAVFPVEYHPDPEGKIVGSLGKGETQGKPNPVLSVEEVRGLIKRVITGSADAEQKLAALFRPMMVWTNAPPQPVSYEQRLKEVRLLVASLRLGTKRTEIEKVFRQMDGGLNSIHQPRYYLGSEVMVEVPYDTQMRLNGPIKIDRSGMHYD